MYYFTVASGLTGESQSQWTRILLWAAFTIVGQDSLAQLLLLLSFVLEHDETGSEPCVALM